MILSYLHLNNYKQYGHLELEFREGLVGVIGKNGAGKSTIFEAILYCLFGKEDGNKSLVRSSFASDPKANVELELAFSIGEILYVVKREFRGKALAGGAELYKNDQLIAKGITAVNEELVELLHMERDAFKRSVFSGQRELSELSDTTGEARKKMVRKMLGLDNLDEVQVKIATEIRDLNSQIVGQRQNLLEESSQKELENNIQELLTRLKDRLPILKKEVATLNKIELEFKTKKQNFETEEKRLNQYHNIERTLAQLRERAKGLNEQRESLLQKEAALKTQKEKIDREKPNFEQFEKEKKQIEQLELERQKRLNQDAVALRIEETKEQLNLSKKQLDALEQQLADKEKVERSLQLKQQEIRSSESEIDQKRIELTELNKQIGGLQSSIDERKKKLDNLRAIGKEGTCPTCFQPLLEGYEKVLSELEMQINQLQIKELQALESKKQQVTEAGLKLKSQQDAWRKQADENLVEHSRLNELARQAQLEKNNQQRLHANLTRDELILNEIGQVHFDEAQYRELKAKNAQLEPQFIAFQSLSTLYAREWPSNQTALQDTFQTIQEVQKQLQSQSDALAQLGYNEAQYLKAKADFSGFDAALAQQSGIVRQLEKEKLETENDVARSREKLQANEQIKSQISGKLEEIELLRRLEEHLRSFKTEILEKVSPGISREASDLFSRITKGKYESIHVDESFDFSIADGGRYYPIERFSGGEIDLANFCLRIAITKAIMDLSGGGQRIEFLAFDEIFGSQDEERRLEIMMALNYLQEQFRQIYIISHIESLRDYFPHLLEIQFAAEGSTAVWR
jgi:exonuclease SbcC